MEQLINQATASVDTAGTAIANAAGAIDPAVPNISLIGPTRNQEPETNHARVLTVSDLLLSQQTRPGLGGIRF